MGRLYKRGKTYWADYIDSDGKRVRKSLKVRDKRNAEDLLRHFEGEARLIESGAKKAEVATPITDALDEYLRGLHRSEKYVDYNRLQITRIAADRSWKLLSDITAKGLEGFILALDCGNRTKQSYITALRSFCKWSVSRGYLSGDPTTGVRKPTPEKSTRRMMLKEEWRKLSAWLQSGEDVIRNGQANRERWLMYWLAIETGYRASELLALTTSDLKGSSLSLSGEHTKNGKDAKQFISDELTAALIAWCSNKLPAASIFRCTDRCDLAEVLRADCLDADVDPENLDFHCLRHTCGSWLAEAGVSMPELQQIMRHADISTTIKHYFHIAPEQESRNRNILGKMLA